MKRMFDGKEITSWVTVILLVLLAVMVTITCIRVISLQNYVIQLSDDMENHFAKLTTTQSTTEENNEPYDGKISITDAPVYGDLSNATYVIIQFSDYECPYCAQASPIVTQILKKYPQQIALVQKDYPLPQHQNARLAAVAARCAGKQGKYWEMANLLFSNQQNLQKQNLLVIAKNANLNMVDFSGCLNGDEFDSVIDENFKEGMALKIAGTPTFIIGKLVANDGVNLTLNGSIISLNDLEAKISEMVGE